MQNLQTSRGYNFCTLQQTNHKVICLLFMYQYKKLTL